MGSWHINVSYGAINNLFSCYLFVKAIVHPKMKIISSFTHPQVFSNLYECLCSAEHNTDFHRGGYGAPELKEFPKFFRISSFVFSRTKTFIQVWKYLRVSKWFHFWVNCPFKFFFYTFLLILYDRVQFLFVNYPYVHIFNANTIE